MFVSWTTQCGGIGKSEGFIVNHFAGKVLYTSEGFVYKNMDVLHDDIERLIVSLSLTCKPFVSGAHA